MVVVVEEEEERGDRVKKMRGWRRKRRLRRSE